ncbi:hypothetical protein SAMN04489860_2313 [Paraoerskovia marina]|uniref:Uncharacterized protein n=1 Tax=Paraoerskovia marina TaxID=545619 RepID=A0A1H1UVQ0_9CELL|nr:hypothetical protein SAMN04489860_2313 [Paraoerskovia marina]
MDIITNAPASAIAMPHAARLRAHAAAFAAPDSAPRSRPIS